MVPTAGVRANRTRRRGVVTVDSAQFSARSIRVLLPLTALVLLAACWSAPLKPRVTEAVLYTQGVAQVTAQVDVKGGGPVVLSLPGPIDEESVQVVAGDVAVTTSLKAVQGKPRSAHEPPKIVEYLCTIGGLPAVKRRLTLKYTMWGLGWSPNYTLRLAADGSARLSMAASIRNHGPAMQNARLKLMSGLVKIRPGSGLEAYLEGGNSLDMASGALAWLYQDGPFRESFDAVLGSVLPAPPRPGDIQLVRVLAGQDIGQDSTLTLPAVTVPVKVTQEFAWDATAQPDEEAGAAERVVGIYRFANAAAKPLAEGIVHVEQGGVPLGDALVSFTPPGQQAVLLVSGAKGIVVKRSVEQTPVPATWATKQDVTLHVENRAKAKVKVAVIDSPMLEQTDYGEIDDNGLSPISYETQPDKVEKNTVSWNLTLAGGAARDLKYSYSVPVDTSKIRVLAFEADGGATEAQYLKQQQGTVASTTGWRQVVDVGYVIYALPVPAPTRRADLVITVSDNTRISLAPDDNGKPGTFKPVMDGVAMRGSVNYGTPRSVRVFLSLDKYLAAGHTVWVKIENAARESDAWAGVQDVEVDPIPAGFKSRGQVYPSKSTLIARAFSDPLGGKTVGVVRTGDEYYDWGKDFTSLLLPGSWIKYKGAKQQLPAAGGSLTIELCILTGYRPGVLISDACLSPDGTTYPTFTLSLVRVDDGHGKLSLGYNDPSAANKWATITTDNALDIMHWYVVVVSWGPKGRTIRVDGQVRAHSDYSGGLLGDAGAAPAWWGLGAVYGKTAPAQDKGTASLVSFCWLKVRQG